MTGKGWNLCQDGTIQVWGRSDRIEVFQKNEFGLTSTARQSGSKRPTTDEIAAHPSIQQYFIEALSTFYHRAIARKKCCCLYGTSNIIQLY